MECIVSNKEDYKFLLQFLLIPFCAVLMIIHDRNGFNSLFFTLAVLGSLVFLILYFYSKKTNIDIGFGSDGIYFLLFDDGVNSDYLVLDWSSIKSIEINKRCTLIKTKWLLEDYSNYAKDQYNLLNERGLVEPNWPFNKFFTISAENSSSFLNPWLKVKRYAYHLIS
jgi:hypothetical protein